MAEKSVHIAVHFRRHSTGKASPGNIGENVPHYRRASIGSCHDFCKYGMKHESEVKDGRKHESEGKERRSIPKGVTRKPLGQSSEESVRETKKSSVVKLRESVDSKPQSAGPGQSSEESVGWMKKTKQGASLDSKPLISALGSSSEESVGRTKKTSVGKQRTPLNSKPLISALGQSSEESDGRTKKMSMGKERASVDSKPRNSALGQSSEESNGGTRKTSLFKLRVSAHSKPQISDTSDMDKKEKPTKSHDSPKQVKNEVLVGRKKTSLVKIQTTSDLSKTMRIRQDISSASKLITSPKWPSLKAKEIRLSGKHVTSSKPISAIVKTISSMKPSKGSDGQRNSELKMVKRASSSKVPAKKFFTLSRASFSPKRSLRKIPSFNSTKHKSLKIVSHLKNQSWARKEEPKHDGYNEVEEKTLYVVKMESENKTLQSDENASDDIESLHPQTLSSPKFCSAISQSSFQEEPEEPEHTTSDVEDDSFSGDHEFEHMENEEALQVEEEGNPRKDGIVCSEDMDCQMLKSKLRRGRVVETQSEKNSPKRLSFRRGKVLEENEDVEDEARRKSSKERDETGAVNNNGATSGSQKVVLRRQYVLGKKDAQGLFNNVIEETASKLAEIRKSKVKALVGAFETVISLQERKPSANTVS